MAVNKDKVKKKSQAELIQSRAAQYASTANQGSVDNVVKNNNSTDTARNTGGAKSRPQISQQTSQSAFVQSRAAQYVEPNQNTGYSDNVRYHRGRQSGLDPRAEMERDGRKAVQQYRLRAATDRNNPYYRALNSNEYKRNSSLLGSGKIGDIAFDRNRQLDRYQSLSRQQAQNYNYLYGKYGRKEAENYLKNINNPTEKKIRDDTSFNQFLERRMGIEGEVNYKALQEKARQDRNNPYVIAENNVNNYFSKPDYSVGKQDDKVRDWLSYTTMTDDEKNKYNYLYAKDGKQAAESYHKRIINDIERRNVEDYYKAKKSTVLNNPLLNVAGQFVGGLEGGIADSTAGVANLITGNKTPRRKGYMELEAQARRSDPDNNFATNMLYDISGAAGAMAPSILATQGLSSLGVGANAAGKAGQALFGLQAGGRGYDEAIAQGNSVGQARMYAAQQAIDEYVTGQLLNGVNAYGGGYLRKGLGETKIAKAASDGIKNFISSPYHREIADKAIQILGDMGSEAAQEFVQNYTEKLTRNLVLGENNKISLKDPEAWYSALVGGLTAGVMNAPANIGNKRAASALGQDLTPDKLSDMTSRLSGERENYLTDEAYNNALKAKALSDEVAARENQGKHNSNYRKGLAVQSLWDAVAESNGNAFQVQNNEPTDNLKPSRQESLPYNETGLNQSKSVPLNEQLERMARMQGLRYTGIEERAKQFNGETGKTYVNNFDRQGNLPIFAYDEGFKAAYNAGRYGGKLVDIKNPSYNMLNISQQEAAYEAGIKDRAFSLKGIEYTQGKERQGGLIETSKPELEHLNSFLDKTGKLTGLNFRVVDRLPYDANGMYTHKIGTVSISLNAENINAAVAHEVSHFMKDYAPEHYSKFQDKIVNALAKSQNMSFEDLVREYMARYEKTGTARTREAIIDEITNDSAAHFLNDKDFVNSFIKENKTVSQKIVDFFNDVLESINSLISKVKNNKAANALRENKKVYENAREVWLNGLNEAGVIYKSGKELVNNKSDVFSIKVSEDGEKISVADTKIFNKKTQDLRQSIAQVIRENIGDYYKILEDGNKIYIGKDLPGEYTYSKSAQLLSRDKTIIKGNIANNLGEMIEIANNGVWEANRKAKHSKDAQFGWYRYDSKVALPMYDVHKNIVSYQVYDVNLLIRNDKNGKKYLYDVMDIKKSNATLLPPAKSPQVSNKNVTLLNNSIDQSEENINNNNDNSYSLKLNSKVNSKKLLKDNEKLRNANNELKRQLKLTRNYVPGKEAISQISDKFLSDTDSTYSKSDLEENLTKIFTYIGTHKGKFTGEIVDITASLAKDVLIQSSEQDNVSDSEAVEMAQDIFMEYLNARAKDSTFADQKKAQLEKAKLEYANKVKEVKEKLKNKYNERINKIKTKNKEQKEKQALKKSGDTLLKQARLLSKMKGSQEFEEAKKRLIGDLDLTSKNMNIKTRLNLNELLGQVKELKLNDPDYITSKGIEERLARLNRKQIGDFSRDEMLELTQAIVELRHLQQTYNKIIGEGKQREISKLGFDLISQMNKVKGIKVGTLGASIDNFATKMLDPKRAFNKLSGYQDDSVLKQLGDELNKGQLKETDFKMKANQMFNPAVKDNKFMNNLKKQNIIITDADGKKAAISPAMRISLYLHSLNDYNMLHIANGGIIVPNEKLYQKEMYGESYGQGAKKIVLKPTQINKIISDMTTQEKEFANIAYKFFNKTTKKAINETSLQLDGYEKAIVDNYFPIKSDRNFNRAEISGLIKDGTIEGMGMLKERVGAKNPILLEDITSVIMRQIDNTAKYYGLAIPVRNFNKVYNFATKGYGTSVKKAISDVWGFNGNKYIEKVLSDIQGGGKPQFSAFSKIRSKFAGATLGMNLGVAMKQAASYPTAAARLGWTPLVKALLRGGKNGHILSSADVDLINKYTPLYWLRSQGNVNAEFGYMAQQSPTFNHGGITEKTAGFFNWIQKADLATVGRLWYASQYYVNDNYQNLQKGSKEYYKQVAKIFNEVVEETQPNYSVMQRPDILRSDSELVRSLTMFMTQRLQNFGILEDSYGELAAKKAQYKKLPSKENLLRLKQAQKRFRNAATSQVVSSATIAAMTILSNFLLYRVKDYRDENGDISRQKLFEQFLSGFFSSVLGNVVGGSEAFNAIEAVRTGNRPYDIVVPAVDSLNDLYNDSINFSKGLHKAFTSEDSLQDRAVTLKKPILKLANSLSVVTGIPVKNTTRLIDGLVRHIQDIKDNEFGSFMRGSDLKSETFYNRAFNKAYVEGSYDEFIKDYNRAVIREKDKDKVDKEIKSRLQKTEEVHEIAQAILNGNPDKATSIRSKLESKGFRNKLAPLVTNAIKSEMEKIQKGDDKKEKPNIPDNYNISLTSDTITELKEEKLQDWISKGGKAETYLSFKLKIKNVQADIDENGKKIPGSKKEKVLDVINNMNLSDNMKDLLYEEMDYKQDKIDQTPWHEDEMSDTEKAVNRFTDYQKKYHEKYLSFGGTTEDFIKFDSDINTFKSDKDSNGKTVKSRKDKVIEYINNLPVSYDEKDRIYYTYYKSRSPRWSN